MKDRKSIKEFIMKDDNFVSIIIFSVSIFCLIAFYYLDL